MTGEELLFLGHSKKGILTKSSFSNSGTVHEWMENKRMRQIDVTHDFNLLITLSLYFAHLSLESNYIWCRKFKEIFYTKGLKKEYFSINCISNCLLSVSTSYHLGHKQTSNHKGSSTAALECRSSIRTYKGSSCSLRGAGISGTITLLTLTLRLIGVRSCGLWLILF